MKKRGQLTAFMLLGLVALIIFLLILYLVTRTGVDSQEFTFEASTIQGFLTSCLSDVSGEGLVLLGKQGGFIEPDEYLVTPRYRVSYLLSNNQNRVPMREEMEAELAMYVNEHLNDCVQDFEVFKKQGWKVTAGEIRTEVLISRLTVNFELDYPITFTEESRSISENRFLTEHNVRLSHIRDVVDEIVESLITYDGLIDMTLLNSLDLSFTIFPYKEKLVFDVEDRRSVIKQTPYHFMFAVNESVS